MKSYVAPPFKPTPDTNTDIYLDTDGRNTVHYSPLYRAEQHHTRRFHSHCKNTNGFMPKGLG